MDQKMPITLPGKIALEEELRKLKTVDRPSIIEAISIARAHGDLSENADYHAAKEKQSFIEGRILELGDKLARAEVIDLSTIKSDKVLFGAMVVVVDDNGKEHKYQIVGEAEADLSKGKISVASPLAKALFGKRAGDEATMRTPRGEVTYEISSVNYG